jgi:hypothetical protein
LWQAQFQATQNYRKIIFLYILALLYVMMMLWDRLCGLRTKATEFSFRWFVFLWRNINIYLDGVILPYVRQHVQKAKYHNVRHKTVANSIQYVKYSTEAHCFARFQHPR